MEILYVIIKIGTQLDGLLGSCLGLPDIAA